MLLGIDFKHFDSKGHIQIICHRLFLETLHGVSVNKMGQKYSLSKTKTYVLHLKHLRYTLMKDFVTSKIKYFLFIYCGIRIKGLRNTAIHGSIFVIMGQGQVLNKARKVSNLN